MRGTLRWTQRSLFAGAAVFLGYCMFVAADAWVFEQRESRNLLAAMAARDLIGRLEIPRPGLSVMLMEGDDAKTLRRAADHIPGTPLPGQPGNAAVSGHRDTFFRPLRNIRENDLILVTTLHGAYRCRVRSKGATCYPFHFAGAAPDRFIVRAERVHSSTQSEPGGLNL